MAVDVRWKTARIESWLIKTEQIPALPHLHRPSSFGLQPSQENSTVAKKPTIRYLYLMSEAHRREKQPEQVRRALLEQAARCAVDQGLGGLTLRAVADAASVTKGGLLHHFPSKQALIEAVFQDLLQKLDEQIDRSMNEDDRERGSFTRAYIDAFFEVTSEGTESPWAALSISCMTDPHLRTLWSDWMQKRIERHAETDDHPDLKIARYAADGIWLANLTETNGLPPKELAALRTQLKNLTK